MHALADLLHFAGRLDSRAGGDVHDWIVAVAVACRRRHRTDHSAGYWAASGRLTRRSAQGFGIKSSGADRLRAVMFWSSDRQLLTTNSWLFAVARPAAICVAGSPAQRDSSPG